jgi:hypothetical protein
MWNTKTNPAIFQRDYEKTHGRKQLQLVTYFYVSSLFIETSRKHAQPATGKSQSKCTTDQHMNRLLHATVLLTQLTTWTWSIVRVKIRLNTPTQQDPVSVSFIVLLQDETDLSLPLSVPVFCVF